MSRDMWIVLLAALAIGGGWIWYLHKSGTKRVQVDEVDPEAPRNLERRRAASEAAASADAALSDADEAEVAELHDYFQEIGTGEFPALAFAADPLGAPIPEDHTYAAPVDFHEVWAGKLSLFVWPSPPETLVPLSSVQVPDPDPLDLESFTRGWTRAQIADMVAGAKAAAR